MPDDPRVRQRIEEMLDSGRSAEEVCRDAPELLPRVREEWRRFKAIEARIDELFPESGSGTDDGATPPTDDGLPRIPGYDLIAVLGRGGVGVVYKAVHQRLNRAVAVKMLLAGAFATRTERQRFSREAELVAELRHPNIVQVYDVGDLEGHPFFTMEFVEGGSLAEVIAGTPRPARQAVELVSKLADAIEAAHRGGIVHRDLKPSNVLLTDDGTPKIGDFGLARHLEVGSSLTQSGAAVGTPSYMAPEQAQGKSSEVGPAADVYSLGAVLYELLTGRPPFRAESAAETVHQLITRDPVPPSRLNGKIPRDLETICLKCLHKEPRHRYATAAALADDLRRFLDDRPIQARPLSWGGRIWRLSRRHPAAVALAASVVVLVGLALGGWVWLAWQRAEDRAETARQEGRTWQAVEAALAQSAALQAQGRWQEAKAALAAAPSLLGTAAPASLPKRVRQARADTDTAAELEELRLAMSESRKSDEKQSDLESKSYEGSFRKFGIDLSKPDPAAAAALIRKSAIRDTLLAYLHDWLFWLSGERGATLRTILDLADDDAWRRSYREAMAAQDTGRLKALAREPGAPDQPPMILSGLGGTLLAYDLRAETLALLRESQRRHPGDFWINYLLGFLLERDRPYEAVGFLRAAVAIRPRSDQAYNALGRALRGMGDPSGSVAALRESVALNPSQSGIWDLARILAPVGRLEEVRSVWEKFLKSDPPDHGAWHGYLQLCLFLGNLEEYHRMRKPLLDRFGENPGNWIIGERVATSCLLLPASGDELRRVAALANYAVADAARFPELDNPFVKFVAGFSEYRQGRLAQAVPLLQEAADKIHDRASPRLVLAMAQFQTGSKREARQTLAMALRTHDWKASAEETVWTSHVLRREAEAMILPNLPAFLRAGHWPWVKDERLVLMGIDRSKGLDHAAARLFADGFAADPQEADDLTASCLDRAAKAAQPSGRTEILNTECRYLAAQCAALAGCGQGNDAIELGDEERTRWRRQAREWLRADLAVLARISRSEPRMAPDLAKSWLTLWRSEPDLAGLRDPASLKKLSADEQKDCLALWGEVNSLLEPTGQAR